MMFLNIDHFVCCQLSQLLNYLWTETIITDQYNYWKIIHYFGYIPGMYYTIPLRRIRNFYILTILYLHIIRLNLVHLLQN